jgi:hypothetical protein
MPILQTIETFGDTFPPVLARAEHLRSPMSIDIDWNLYTQKIFPPGFFAGTHVAIPGATPPVTANPDRYRILPRTRQVGAAAGNTLTVTPFTAGIFVVGEVITAIDPTTGASGGPVGTIASINHAANTITLTAAPGAGAGAGNTIGVQASAPVMANGNRLGLITPNTTLDFSMRPNSQFGLFLSATCYRNRMPYLDAFLAGLYPELNFV